MPDIAMCNNQWCKAKSNCYRHVMNTAPCEYRQAYGGFGTDDNEACEYYWRIKNDGEIPSVSEPE